MLESVSTAELRVQKWKLEQVKALLGITAQLSALHHELTKLEGQEFTEAGEVSVPRRAVSCGSFAAEAAPDAAFSRVSDLWSSTVLGESMLRVPQHSCGASPSEISDCSASRARATSAGRKSLRMEVQPMKQQELAWSMASLPSVRSAAAEVSDVPRPKSPQPNSGANLSALGPGPQISRKMHANSSRSTSVPSSPTSMAKSRLAHTRHGNREAAVAVVAGRCAGFTFDSFSRRSPQPRDISSARLRCDASPSFLSLNRATSSSGGANCSARSAGSPGQSSRMMSPQPSEKSLFEFSCPAGRIFSNGWFSEDSSPASARTPLARTPLLTTSPSSLDKVSAKTFTDFGLRTPEPRDLEDPFAHTAGLKLERRMPGPVHDTCKSRLALLRDSFCNSHDVVGSEGQPVPRWVK